MGQINVPSRGHEERPDEIASNVTAYGLDGVGGIILEILEAAEAYNRRIVDFIRPYLEQTNLELRNLDALHLPWGQSALFVWQRT